MNYFILLVSLILSCNIGHTQNNYELGLRFGSTIHKMNIEETDNGYFYLRDPELIPYYEIYLKYKFEKFDIEAGLGVLEINQLLTSKFKHEDYEFPFVSSAGEAFAYIAFPIRIKKEYHVNSWLSFTPGIELTSAYLFDDMIFSTLSKSCISFGGSVRSCNTFRLHEMAHFTTGLGLNGEININIFNRVALGVFGFRNWRVGKGWTVDITREFEDSFGNITESYRGTGRPSLTTWNFGVKISVLW